MIICGQCEGKRVLTSGWSGSLAAWQHGSRKIDWYLAEEKKKERYRRCAFRKVCWDGIGLFILESASRSTFRQTPAEI